MSGITDTFNGMTIAVAAVAGLLAWVLLSRLYSRRPRASTLSKPEIEQQFRTVFGLTPVERQEALISHYMAKHRCNRHEAMKIAMEARHADEERW